jgi:hypothetical protein
MDLTGEAAEALGASAALATMRGLWLSHCPAVDLMPLLRSPHASGLRSLCVWGEELPEETFTALSRPNVLPALEHLDLPPTAGRAQYAAALTARGRRLRSLCLRDEMTVAGVRALGRSEACSELRRLDITLSRNRFPLKALAGARFWATLESVDLMNVGMTEEAATALARVQGPGLRSLSILGPRTPPTALARLAGSPLFASLTHLDLRSQPIGPPLAAALTLMPAAPLSLTISGCGIGDEGLVALAGWPGLSRCRLLQVANSQLTAAGMRALADSPHLGGMVGLNVVFNPLGDAGIEALTSAAWLGGLEYLAVSECEGGAGGAAALNAAARRMPRLKQLSVGKEMITPALLEAFARVPYVG